jgi:lysozyme
VTSALVLDHSSNNPLPTPAACAELGAAIEKLSEGNGYLNPTAADAIAIYRAAKLPVGGYHFLHPEEAIGPQVSLFAEQLRRFGIGRAFVDVELGLDGSASEPSGAAEWHELGELVAAFVTELEETASHPAVTVYTSESWDAQGITPAGVDLWLAAYGLGTPPAARPPRTCALWQWTDTGRLPGLAPADLSYAYVASLPRYFRCAS